jgi:transcriptional regulator with XRE-family HTH domain
MDEDTVAKRIKRARQALHPKVSQDELAKRLGVATMTVSRWETGALNPERDSIAKLAEALGVEARWIAYGDARSPEPSPDTSARVEIYPEDYSIFHEWLETPEGQSATEEEIGKLRSTVFHDGGEGLTLVSLHYALMSLRSRKASADRAPKVETVLPEGTGKLRPTKRTAR